MSTEIRIWVWLAFALVAGWLLYLLAPVLTPFMAAALLAYLGDPIVDRLQRRKLPRTLAVATVFTTIVLLLLLLALVLIPLLEGQITALLQRLPGYVDVLQSRVVPWLQQHFDLTADQFKFDVLKQKLDENLATVGGLMVGVLTSLTHSSMVVLGWLMNLLLIPVITFYLLLDWDRMIGHIHDMLPRPIEPVISRLAREADEVLAAFMKGQLIVMLVLGLIYSIGLFLVGLEFALLFGMLAGIVSFVPYLGLIVGLTSAGIAAIIQFQDALHVLGVLAVFSIGQVAEAVWLTPTLVGDRIGLHPVAVIFAILAGGFLFGFFGVLLALPVAAVIMVLLRNSYRSYRASRLYLD
jgi:predicted PurR-regulated permease PerM